MSILNYNLTAHPFILDSLMNIILYFIFKEGLLYFNHSFIISLEHLLHMKMASQSIVTRKEHIERKSLVEYKSKFSINDKILPDPIVLKEGWIGEKFWPRSTLMSWIKKELFNVSSANTNKGKHIVILQVILSVRYL